MHKNMKVFDSFNTQIEKFCISLGVKTKRYKKFAFAVLKTQKFSQYNSSVD